MSAEELSIIKSTKRLSDTLGDIADELGKMGVREEWFPQKGDDGRTYTINYTYGGAWQKVSSSLQPTLALNARQCWQVIRYLRLWASRGVVGATRGVSFIGGLVPTGDVSTADEFKEACVTLGVKPDEDLAEIESVAKARLKYHHPDLAREATEKAMAEERAKAINSALDIIRKVKGKKTTG